MPSSRTILRVFVASPSDTSDERRQVELAIEQVNTQIANRDSIQFEYIGWDKTVVPEIGMTPQSVIDEQVSGHDIFIGILRTRFGVPTDGFGSGTEKEFDNAIAQSKSTSNFYKLHAYFYNGSINLSEIDVGQFAKVKTFKESMNDRGVLYKNYVDMESLRQFIVLNLTKDATDYLSSSSVSSKAGGFAEVKKTNPDVDQASCADEEVELGWLDLIEDAAEHLDLANTAMARLSTKTEDLGTDIAVKSAELQQIDNNDKELLRKQKRVINSMAAIMNEYALACDRDVHVMHEEFVASTDAVQKMIPLSHDFPNQTTLENLRELSDTLIESRTAYDGAIEQVVEFTRIIDSMPRATTAYNAAKRNVGRTMKKTTQTLESYVSVQDEILLQIQSAIQKLEKTICDESIDTESSVQQV